MAMLGSPCSPCCACGPCPDYSIFESAQTLYATVSYSYGYLNTNIFGADPRNVQFSGVYPLSKDANGWSSGLIEVGGVGHWRLVARLVEDTLSAGTLGLRFFCTKNNPQSALAINSFGFIGFDEFPCSGEQAVARAVGRYSLDVAFNFGSGKGGYRYSHRAGGNSTASALSGLYLNLDTDGQEPIYRNSFLRVRVGASPTQRLVNSCFVGNASGTAVIKDLPPTFGPKVTFDYYNKDDVGPNNPEYLLSDSLEVFALEADFGSFRHNMLMRPCGEYWANQIGTEEEVGIEVGGSAVESFTEQTTRCSSLAAATPPSAPQNLTATRDPCSTVVLEWDAPETDGGTPITAYLVQFRRVEGLQYITFGTVAPNVFSATIEGLVKVGYQFRVRAINAGGAGAFVNVTDGFALAAPTGLAFTRKPPCTSAELTWTPPPTDECVAVASYLLQFRVFGTFAWTTAATLAGDAVAGTVAGLTAGTRYQFRVGTVDEADVQRFTSILTSGSLPAIPTGVTAVIGGNPGEVDVSWIADEEDCFENTYLVQFRSQAVSTWSDGPQSANKSVTVTGLSTVPNPLFRTYFFRVRSTNSIGDSAFSEESSAIVIPIA